MQLKSLALALAGVALSAVVAMAQAPIKPAIVYDKGGKFDKSFNEGVFAGAEKFKTETGVDFRDFEPTNDAQIEQALRRFARDGHSPIIAVGFSQATALQKVAAEFPALKFTIIDMVVDLPNVQSVVFKEHEGSYLVGLLAGMASKSGKVGFVGYTAGLSGMSAYAASKAGQIGLVKALAAELGSQGIRVNALLPGGTDTPASFTNAPDAGPQVLAFVEGLHALKRMARPEEIARAALFLASDASSFVTGTAFLADGGVSIQRG